MGMSNSTTKAEREERYEIVQDLLISGYEAKDIFKKHGLKWGVSIQTIYNYIKESNRLFSKDYGVSKKAEFAKSLKRLQRVVKKADESEDPKLIALGIQAQKEINNLLDLPQVGKDIAAQEGTPLVIQIQEVKPMQREKGDGVEFK